MNRGHIIQTLRQEGQRDTNEQISGERLTFGGIQHDMSDKEDMGKGFVRLVGSEFCFKGDCNNPGQC